MFSFTNWEPNISKMAAKVFLKFFPYIFEVNKIQHTTEVIYINKIYLDEV